MEEKTIGPGWSGIVTKENIEPLAKAIEQQFWGKRFSALASIKYSNSLSPENGKPMFYKHLRLEQIRPHADASLPFIWIIIGTQWCIHEGEAVTLTERTLLKEKLFRDGSYDTWCWMLEE